MRARKLLPTGTIVVIFSSCGLLSEGVTITVSRTLPFRLDIEAYVRSFEQQQGQTLPDPMPSDYPRVTISGEASGRVDLSRDPNLANYRGAIRSITLDALGLRVRTNTANLTLDPIGFYLGSASTSRSADADKIAETPRITPGGAGEIAAAFTTQGAAASSAALFGLDFKWFVRGAVTVPQGTQKPKGYLEGEVTLTLSIKVGIPHDAGR